MSAGCRPSPGREGTPIEHTSIPFLISMQGTTQQMNQNYMDKVMANMLKQADDMQTSIDTMQKMQSITGADGRDHAQHGRRR